jgi:K+-sensing histidine kinase KdpD
MHPLLVLTVLDSHRLLSRDEDLRMEQREQLCARSRRITQIVLGQSRATSLAGLQRRPLSLQLQRQPRGLGINLHLIGESADESAAEPAAELER